jgi:leucyl aminopeptidase
MANTPAISLHLLTPAETAGWLERAGAAAQRQAATADFRGQAGKNLLLLDAEGAPTAGLVGMGERPTPLLVGGFAKEAPPATFALSDMRAGLDPTQIAVAWEMGAYVFDRYKPRRRPAAKLLPPEGGDAAEAERVAAAVRLVRDLVNTPAADMGPQALHQIVEDIAASHGATFAAVVGDRLLSDNYPMIHAVGRAAKETPRLLHLRWGEEAAPRLALVGKGITFDSGGLDIKPSSGMRLMKKDMGGAAHALALARLVMEAKLRVRLDLWLAVAENAVSADAFRPGDILKSRKGLSVEIDNTDAEGRLVLGDALARACEEKPDLVLDYATLTGAARVALGPDLPPIFTMDDALARAFEEASRREFDPLWRLPLWDAYDADLDSPIADIANSNTSGFAGAILGALFLRRFVDAKSWAHFDVYAWSPKDKPGRPAGGDAHALRASWAVLKERYGGR